MTLKSHTGEEVTAAAGATAREPAAPGRAVRRVRRLGVTAGMRDVRVVHPLDGIEHDVTPQALLAAGHALWHAWRANPAFRPHQVIVGLDAGGIVPALSLALASRTPYRLAWKLDLDLPGKHLFHEPHARRAEVFVYGDLRDRHVLVADDEVTTGRTVTNLIGVLRAAGADVVGVACLVEDTAGHGRRVLADEGVPLCALTSL